jgi:acetyltransferase-like isoleucine patch superfamily enzyme
MILDLLRGIGLLRHRDLVRRLGDMLSLEREIEKIREQNPGAHVSSDARFLGWPEGVLSLGEGSRIEFGTIIALGDRFNGFGALSVGKGTWIGPYNNLRISGGTSVDIGEGCLISQFCSIVSSNHSLTRSQRMIDMPPSSERQNVTIGSDVWLGASAVVLPGVNIGNGAVIAAGSIVTRSIPAFEIWAGNPGRKTGERPL